MGSNSSQNQEQTVLMTEATLSQGTDQLQEHPKAATSPGATLWIPMSFRKGRARLCTLSDQPSFSSTNHLNVKPLLTLEDHPSKKCKAVPAIAKKKTLSFIERCSQRCLVATCREVSLDQCDPLNAFSVSLGTLWSTALGFASF